MAEQFLTLMADLDDASQAVMGAWYGELQKAGYNGVQTPGLPYHISLASFALDKEKEAVNEAKRLANEFGRLPVDISHIGMFADGKVLFAAPDMSVPDLLSLRKAIRLETADRFSWTPHATILIDEPDVTYEALRVLLKSFRPFTATVTKLHLCAFWPTREIISVELK